jgi:predicted AlkP superfamily pyrophosphatase or phosphodiesterase
MNPSPASERQPLIILNTVALTGRHLPLAPRLHALAQSGWSRPLREVVPAVTCSAQASMLTGKLPQEHGIVGNGWLYRDTMEVRFWQQSNHLLQAEPVYVTARKAASAANMPFRCAKIFWWFNQGAQVDISVTPKPHYGADGSKAFDILTTPESLAGDLKKKLGDFPFPTFWGPMAGLPCSAWIARCAAEIVQAERPDLTLVYLPHLDYDTQRLGPAGCDWPRLATDLDQACAPLLDTARQIGARVWVVNEYAHVQVDQPILINRALRKAGLLTVRGGPFGEQIDFYGSLAFAVCDHQWAHVYLNDQADMGRVKDVVIPLPGVARVLQGEERSDVGLNHPRAGDLVALAKPNAWFAYPYWLDERLAPDFARTVDIHRKPGYDPCELFFDPALLWPKGRAIRRLLQKNLGFRTLFDLIPLDPGLVRGSHGLPMEQAEDCPVFIGDGPPPPGMEMKQTDVHGLILEALLAVGR